MKTIEVVAAIIRNDNKYLATKRGYGDYKNYWEFPGGKIEPKESKEAALIREIQEELEAAISIDQFLCTIEYDYPSFHLILHCYFCSIINNSKIRLVEHKDAKWLARDELDSVEWLPADIMLIDKLKALY